MHRRRWLDAVAGVVNVIMDDKFEGFKLQLDGGETSYNDGGDMHAALAFGKAFLDGRLHEVFGSEYEDSQTIGFWRRGASLVRPVAPSPRTRVT